MTSTRPDPAAADRWQTFLDWTRINARAMTIAGVIVAVAAASYWFYARSRQIQAANAEKALMNAKQSLGAGNMPLAQSDLQKVYSRYSSTSAGVEAALLLAQVDYDQHKPQDGLNVLKKASGSGAAAAMESTVRSLIGDGYMQLGKPVEAAKEYEAAAAVSRLDNERANQRAKAARAYGAVGDTARARKLWSDLLEDPKAQAMASEARVRIGELTARVAKK